MPVFRSDHFIVLLTYSDTAQLSFADSRYHRTSIQDVVNGTEGEMQLSDSDECTGFYLITDHHEQINTMIDCAALALRKDFQKEI